MTEQEMIKYIGKAQMVSVEFSLPFDDEQETQEVETIISNLMKLEKQGYDIWGHFHIDVSFNPTSKFDCNCISSFFEKYKNCHFLTVQDKALRNILNSNFKSEITEILQKSNIIYNTELKDIDKELLKKFQIKSIIIGNDIGDNEEKFSLPISIEQYEEIMNIARRITSDLPKDNEKLKLFAIEQRLASILTLDTNDKGDDSLDEKRNRNLECLLQKKAVCLGCAEALTQMCCLAGIECRVILSLEEKQEQHAYNQVKINGIWYNTDLTWDMANNLKYGVMPQFFLLSDKTFKDRCNADELAYHCTKHEFVHKCDTDMHLSMEEVEMCTRNLRDWEKTNRQLEITDDEISIE